MKGTVAHMKPPANSIIRANETAYAGWVIFPKYQSSVPAQLKKLSRSRAFIRIADNAFNYSLLGIKGFETLTGLVDASQCYDFTYSSLENAIETFSALEPPASSK
jgi:hypothetical protein